MGEAGTFKTTTFGGFDKKSVLSYIDALNEQFHAAEADYSAKLEEYARAQDSQVAHIKKLEAQLADQEGKLTAVAEQLEKERGIARQAQEMISSSTPRTRPCKNSFPTANASCRSRSNAAASFSSRRRASTIRAKNTTSCPARSATR